MGTVGYMLIVFPLAYVWHLVLFKPTYHELGYFSREEPVIAFGLAAIALQGMLLSVVYPHMCRSQSKIRNLVVLVVTLGGYHWTIHVLAEAAKHPVAPLTTWFALESAYLLIQFVAAGLLLGFIYRQPNPAAELEPTND